MKIKVLILAPQLDGHGGVSEFIKTLIANLDNNIDIKHFIIGSRPNQKSSFKQFFSDSASLIKILKTEPFDAIHINPSLDLKSTLRDGFFLLLFQLLKMQHVLIFIHGWEYSFFMQINRNIIFKRIFRFLLNGASKTIVLAEQFKQSLIDAGVESSKITVMSTMFNADIFRGTEIKKTKEGDIIYLLFLSRLIKEKGVFKLLEAFDLLKEKIPNLNLTVAGDGPDREKAELWVNQHNLQQSISFTGFVTGDEKTQILVNSDIFVFPTYFGEGCPVVLLEAMAAGLPIITTRAGGIPDIVKNSVNGILLDSTEPNEIAAAIETIVYNAGLAQLMKKTNTITAYNKYESSIVSKNIEQLYYDIIYSNPS